MHIHDSICAVKLVIICAYSYKCFNPFSSKSNIFNHMGLSHELNQYQAEEINKAHTTVGLSLILKGNFIQVIISLTHTLYNTP